MASQLLLAKILSHFPQQHLQLVFAYGSGAFQQYGRTNCSQNMLDLIFAVNSAKDWHSQNVKINPKHYSFLRHMGPRYISYVQDKIKARVYYNTLISCENRLIKYGVIEETSLINDLLDWETLYIAGRLHKPVHFMLKKTDTNLSLALNTNLQSAIHASLLLLPEYFSEESFYTTVAGLSYGGDFRMSIAEDQNKVHNIVVGNLEHFRKLYEPLLEREEHVHWNKSQGVLTQSLSFASRYHHLNLLPKTLIFGLVNQRSVDGKHRDTEEILRSYARSSEVQQVISQCLQNIVQYSSLAQSFKGILTAGLLRSLRYSTQKVRKRLYL